MELFNIKNPEVSRVPVLISSPHSGIDFPEELRGDYVADKIQAPEDADWFMPELYNFASELGITVISANLCRWVIDLNRDPESVPLYNDGRLITGLCPTTNFMGEAIYQDGKAPDKSEIERRLNTYYWPYYQKIQEILDDLKSEFGHVLLYDLHSITRRVETISKDDFPDIVLGTAERTSADNSLIDIAESNFKNSNYSFAHNHPFKGGHITRYFGKPEKKQHALQVERSKDIYMDEDQKQLNESKCAQFRPLLKKNLEQLISQVQSL